MAAKHLDRTPTRGPGKAFALGGALALMLLSVPSAFAVQDASKGNPNGKQTICHATDSNTNPYVVITPNKNGDVDGHAKHTGPIWNPNLKKQHIEWGDIIPPFDYNNHGKPAHYPGLNWTTEGQAIFNNGCQVPTSGGGGTTTGGTTTGGTTTGGTTTGGTTTGGTTTGGATTGGAITGGGGAITGGGGAITGGGGAITGGGGGGAITGGGGGAVTTRSTLPRTGAAFTDQLSYGAALVLAGIGILLLTPRRRSAAIR